MITPTWPDGAVDTVTRITAPTGNHPSDASNALRLGAASWGEYFTGVTDEVRISQTVRSVGWIQTTYNTIHGPETFLSVGAEEALSGGSCTYAINLTSASAGAAGGWEV
jgi:hypothetical protein